MFKLITFAIIFTHSVIAQAAGLSGSIRLETQKWVTAYSGETEVDGLPVFVNMDVARNPLQIPDAMVGVNADQYSVVPFNAPEKKAYRLTFIVCHNPRIQTTYVIHPRTVSIDGAPRFAYVSELDAKRDFTFLVTAAEDGRMNVAFTRKFADGSSGEGKILLNPVPSILTK